MNRLAWRYRTLPKWRVVLFGPHCHLPNQEASILRYKALMCLFNGEEKVFTRPFALQSSCPLHGTVWDEVASRSRSARTRLAESRNIQQLLNRGADPDLWDARKQTTGRMLFPLFGQFPHCSMWSLLKKHPTQTRTQQGLLLNPRFIGVCLGIASVFVFPPNGRKEKTKD